MAELMTLREALRRCEVFQSLDEQTLSMLERRMTAHRYAPGQTICREGDVGETMFVIAAGEVRVLKQGEGGSEVEVAILKAGEVAGTMSLFEQDVRSASLRAKGPVQIWRLDRDTFQFVLSRNPRTAEALLAQLSHQLRRETDLVAHLLSEDADTRLRVAVFDSKPYTAACFRRRNGYNYALRFFEPRLKLETVSLADGFRVICPFVNDQLEGPVIERLARRGVELIAMRCAGYNNVDLEAAHACGLSVVRVPAYSPAAVAEHAVALLQTLNRRTHRAFNRVREGNFSLDGLVGMDLCGRTAGVVGVGKIGQCMVRILTGFGMTVLGYDEYPNPEFADESGMQFVPFDDLLSRSDVISLHVPLLPSTRHMIDAVAIARMKPGVILINTSRGGLVDTAALIDGLKSGAIGAAGLDVYEEEQAYFFEDLSNQIIIDDLLARLTTFHNVLITSHQGFLTQDALDAIADTTFLNIREYEEGKRAGNLTNAVLPKQSTPV